MSTILTEEQIHRWHIWSISNPSSLYQVGTSTGSEVVLSQTSAPQSKPKRKSKSIKQNPKAADDQLPLPSVVSRLNLPPSSPPTFETVFGVHNPSFNPLPVLAGSTKHKSNGGLSVSLHDGEGGSTVKKSKRKAKEAVVVEDGNGEIEPKKVKKSQKDLDKAKSAQEAGQGTEERTKKQKSKEKGKGKAQADIGTGTEIISMNAVENPRPAVDEEVEKKRKSTKKPKSTNDASVPIPNPEPKAKKPKKPKSKPIPSPPPPRSDEYDELDSDEMDELEIDDLLPSSPVRQFRLSPSLPPSKVPSTSTTKNTTPKSAKRSKKRKSQSLDSSALDTPSAPDHLRGLSSLPQPLSTSTSVSASTPGPAPTAIEETPASVKVKKSKAPKWCTSTPPVRAPLTPVLGSTSKKVKKGKDTPKKGPLVRLGATWATSTPPARQWYASGQAG